MTLHYTMTSIIPKNLLPIEYLMDNQKIICTLSEQLINKSSTKRRSAAKKLRKLKAFEAGPALLDALKKELLDERTWETKYQIIMAIGESNYTDALEFITELANQEFKATMLYIAIGDTITRLNYAKKNSCHEALKYIGDTSINPLLIDGILRAIAILRLVPEEKDILKIISYGNSPEASDNNITWISSAAAGWKGDEVDMFLKSCVTSKNPQTKKAAELALKNKYPKWSIL